MADNTQYQKVKEITDQLEQGIQDLFESEKYMSWLRTMSRFHDYSLNNTLLIAFQKPDATLVAGYTAWQKQFGRQVQKGEKAIKILAPAPYKEKVEIEKLDPVTKMPIYSDDGKPIIEVQEVTRPAFKVVSVFDVSQTEGREIPSLGVDELSGDVREYEMFFEALKRNCPVPMEFENIEGSAKGYYHQMEQRIAIREGMSQVQTIKTAIHEMAHQRLHAVDPLDEKSEIINQSRSSKEVEAESVAYTVCQHYGIETSDYSFAYVAGWSHGKETPELKASLNTIRKTANEMITEIDGHIAEINKEMEQENKVTCYLKITSSMGSEYEIDRIAGTIEKIESVLKEALETEVDNIPEFLESKGIPVLVVASSIDDELGRYIRPEYEFDIDRKQIYRDGIAIGREMTREESAVRLAVKVDFFLRETDNFQYKNEVEDPLIFTEELKNALMVGSERVDEISGWFQQIMDEDSDYTNEAIDLVVAMKNMSKEGREITKREQAEHLAGELYEYADEVDPYGSQDSIEYVEEFIRATTKDLLDAGEKAEGILKWLEETPVATAALETRGKELRDKVSAFAGISIEPEATISFYVAECSEFPTMGEFHDGVTLEEAFRLYDQIPAERMNGIKGIGFELHDGSEYDGQYPLMEAGRVEEELINMVQHYKDSPLVQQAILDCKRILSEREQALSEGNYRIGKEHYLELHRTDDGSWDYTLYNKEFLDADGGQIGVGHDANDRVTEVVNLNLEQAVKEVLKSYGMELEEISPMDKEAFEQKRDFAFARDMYDKGFVYEDYVLSNRIAYELREDGIDLWDFSSEQSSVIYEAAEQGLDVSTFAKPDFSVEQMELMKELLEDGNDVTRFVSNGKILDLSEKVLSDKQVADIRYFLKVDEIPKELYSEEQWKVMQRGIRERLDVTQIANPNLAVVEMKDILKELRKEKREAQAAELEGTLGLQDNGKYRYYSTQRPISSGTYPNGENKPVSIENFDERQLVENGQLQAWGYLEYAEPLSQKEMKEYELKAVSASVTRVNTLEKQTEKKKSVLADLHKKQEQISGVKTPKKEHVKKNDKEMQV